jgi:hypothetical protein
VDKGMEEVSVSIHWPDLKLPPINQPVLIPADQFEKLRKEKTDVYPKETERDVSLQPRDRSVHPKDKQGKH